MTENRLKGCHGVSRRLGLAALFLALALPAMAADQKQTMFATPEEAAKAIVDAATKADNATLMAILGPEAEDVLASGDEVADKAALDRFVAAAKQATRLEKVGDAKVIINVGTDDWPMPIPIVKGADGWYFDTAAGEDEIINRRVGRKRARAIDVCRAYVQAQREYAGKDRDGSGVLKFAQKVTSSRASRTASTGRSRPGRGQPLRAAVADAIKEGLSEEGRPADSLSRLLLQGPEGAGLARAGRGLRLRHQRQHDRRLRARRLAGGMGRVRRDDLHRQPARHRLSEGPSASRRTRSSRPMAKYDPDSSWTKVQ